LANGEGITVLDIIERKKSKKKIAIVVSARESN
jgi:hypothetical protein